MAQTTDDLKRQARVSRLGALMGANAQRRKPPMRMPQRPEAGPPLETVAPSIAQDVGTAVQSGAGLVATGVGFVNPVLGMMLGMMGNVAGQYATQEVAKEEAKAAEAVQERNKMRLGQARLQDVKYQSRLRDAERAAQAQQMQPMQGAGMPMAGQVQPGAADKTKALLRGGY